MGMKPAALFVAGASRRLPPRIARWAAHLVAAELFYPTVDALLLGAIMDRESNGGDALKPPGPGGFGDFGHGRGLMQIDDRTHGPFLRAAFDDGPLLWTEPAFNVLYAARLLTRNLEAFNGEEDAAVAAYNCGIAKVARHLPSVGSAATEQARIALLDALTANGNYVSDVFKRRDEFKRHPLDFQTPKGGTPV